MFHLSKLAGCVFDQLAGDVDAALAAFAQLAVTLPVAVARLGVERRRRGVGDARGGDDSKIF